MVGNKQQYASYKLACCIGWDNYLPQTTREISPLPVNANQLLADKIHASMDMMARQQSGRFMQAPWGLNKLLLDGGLAWYANLKLKPQPSVP